MPTRNGGIEKAAVGIHGFDFITGGGLPRGRPTLITGPSGSGKTIFAMEFLAHGARELREPAVYLGFEETKSEILANFASFDLQLSELAENNLLFIDHLEAVPVNVAEAGSYDLDGLFVRLDQALKAVDGRRLVLDAFPALFAGFRDAHAVRSGLIRLFGFLKERGVTTIATAESSTEVSRYGLGHSLSDCVVHLDSRVSGRVATRHLRVAKYRGSAHQQDEFPFLIDTDGITVIPPTSVRQDYRASRERITSGVTELDEMLEGTGLFRGSSVFLSGEAGTGKTSLAAHLAASTCERGERSLFVALEESRDEVMRNMESIGLDFTRFMDEGLLRIYVSRASRYDLEMHLATLQKQVDEFEPSVVIIDPISNLLRAGSVGHVTSMVSRLVDFLKAQGITALFTVLTKRSVEESPQTLDIASVMDTWIRLRNNEINGEHTRLLDVLKARGMAHSNQVREFQITGDKIRLVDVYVTESSMLTGTARVARLEQDRREADRDRTARERETREFEYRRSVLQNQIETLQAELKKVEEDYRESREWDVRHRESRGAERAGIARERRSGHGTEETGGDGHKTKE